MNDLMYILLLAIVVTIHEFGHYFCARLMNVKVQRVQLFFMSWFTYKPKPSKTISRSRTSWRDTEYSIGFLPFGGYTTFFVNPYGKIGDKDVYYNTKRAWRRFMISIAGVLFNILTAIIIYMVIILMSHNGASFESGNYLSATFEFISSNITYTISGVMSMLGVHLEPTGFSGSNVEMLQAYFDTALNYEFLMQLANLSCILAMINILPIPPLDGGQALFDLYEMFTGRQPNAKFKKVASWIGSIAFIIIFWILPMISRIKV